MNMLNTKIKQVYHLCERGEDAPACLCTEYLWTDRTNREHSPLGEKLAGWGRRQTGEDFQPHLCCTS